MLQLTTISTILFITTLINVFASVIAWQRRKKIASGLYFALGMAGITFWTLMTGLEYAAVPIRWKVFFATLEGWGYMTALSCFALGAISFAGYEHWIEKKWLKALFLSVPALNILLVTTNGLHGWVWSAIWTSDLGGNMVSFERGPGFIWVTLTVSLMLAIMIAYLWLASRSVTEVSRRQARLMLSAGLFLAVTNLVYLLAVPGFEQNDWTPIPFSVSGVAFLWALLGPRALDLVPVARYAIIEQMRDSILVLDVYDQLADFNPNAQKNFDLDQSHLGLHINAVLAKWPGVKDIFPIDRKIESRMTVHHKAKSKVFDTRVTRLLDMRGILYGKLIVFMDITQRFRAEEALEWRLQEIKQLHQTLEETQTQDVEEQRELAMLEERQRLGRDMHDSVNQSIHSLMLSSETLVSLLSKGQTENAIQVAERIQESGRQALKEIRLLIYESHPNLTDENTDILAALEERLNMVERRVGLCTEFYHNDDFMEHYVPEWNENLYWMIMEALNNALKHAKARRIRLIMNCSERQLDMKVLDDGIGFDLGRLRGGGLGMRTMQERAATLGGELHIESSPGHGTSVCYTARIRT